MLSNNAARMLIVDLNTVITHINPILIIILKVILRIHE